MRTTLYEIVNDIEVSVSSGSQKDFSFRSNLKGIDFDFAILKYRKIQNDIETVIEREKAYNLVLSDRNSFPASLKISDPVSERLEAHIILHDDSYRPSRFCFDLGSFWQEGGRFYIRKIDI